MSFALHGKIAEYKFFIKDFRNGFFIKVFYDDFLFIPVIVTA